MIGCITDYFGNTYEIAGDHLIAGPLGGHDLTMLSFRNIESDVWNVACIVEMNTRGGPVYCVSDWEGPMPSTWDEAIDFEWEDIETGQTAYLYADLFRTYEEVDR